MKRFNLLLTRHRTPGVKVLIPGEEQLVRGEYVTSPPTEMDLECAIIPMASRLVYESAGRYTSADRELYTRTKLEPKSVVQYNQLSYSVEEETDYTALAGLYQYRIKAVPNLNHRIRTDLIEEEPNEEGGVSDD